MVVILVVPIEEAATERSGILDTPEALGEPRLVFQDLEVCLRVRVRPKSIESVVRPAIPSSSWQGLALPPTNCGGGLKKVE